MSLPCVLLIEDNATTRKLFRVALEAEGYVVVEAGDGKEGIAKAVATSPDLVLIDLVLPDAEGLQVALELRALPFGRALPIMAVSGFKRLLDKACLEPNAFDGFLLKPVDIAQLVEQVGNFVAKPKPSPSQSPAAPPTVLLVDDDPVQLKLMRVRLELEGFRVITAADSDAAIGLAHSTRPDIVLCDVLMPGKDGYELCLAMRNAPALAEVPVVLVSAHYGGAHDEQLAKQVGASAFVVRTPDIKGVVSALNAALEAGPLAASVQDLPRVEHAERLSAQLKRQARVNASWAERSASQVAQLTILAGVGKAFSRSEDVEASFGEVLATCLDTGGISRGALYRFDALEKIVCTHAIGFADDVRPSLANAFGRPQLLEQVRLGSVVAPSTQLSEPQLRQFLADAGATAVVLVPLVGDRRCLGALLLASNSRELGEEDLSLFGRAIATHAAQALAMAGSMSRLKVASDASRLLSSSLDLNATLAAFAKLATEHVADVCVLHLAGEEPQRFARNGHEADTVNAADPAHTFVATLLAHERPLGTVTMIRAARRRPFQEFDRLFAEDLTQRAAIAIDNALLYQAAQDASRQKDEFLATISHELRTPLNAILGWSRLLADGLSPEKQAQAVRVIERNALAQSRLIEDTLDIASLLSKKTQLELRSTPLAKIIELALETVRPILEQKRHTLELGPIDPQLLVLADPDRLQQVIFNLLGNAVKFTPAGGQICLEATQRGGQVVLRVRDNGVGIEAEFLPHVFERFKQADGSMRRAHGGLGLGLAITHQLIELHQGTIGAESEGKGRGATFTLTLPLAEGAEQALRDSSPGSMRWGTLGSAGLLRDVNVLIVDDEQDSRELAAVVLRECGAHATLAASSAEAIGAILRSPPDLLVSDIGMPGEDGYALIEKVRALSEAEGGKIPAVALTGYVQPKDRTRAMSAGYNTHLAKPFEPAELVATVASLLKAQRAAAPPSR